MSAYDPEFDRAVMARPIVDNASPRLYERWELDGEECPECEGDGGWTETVEGPGDSDVEITKDCNFCDGTGVLP